MCSAARPDVVVNHYVKIDVDFKKKHKIKKKFPQHKNGYNKLDNQSIIFGE